LPEPITYVEHAADVIDHAVDLAEAGRRFALITSINIEGGAAREVGSLALVDDQGAMVGYLSNGCIDRDIQLQAVAALDDGAQQIVRYGDGSRFADLKLPCGGALTILIDPAPDMDALRTAQSTLSARKPATLAFQADAATRFEYLPRFRLVLAGRGAIFRAMVSVGQSAGFEVQVLSPEEDDLAAIGPQQTSAPVHLTAPRHAPKLKALDAYSAFLTLFHDHEWEPALLAAALDTPARFIGSLGSQRTHQQRLDQMRDAGVAADDLNRLHGPIGLVPSLREAPLIAVSAMSQVIAAFPPAVRQIG